MNTTIHLHRTWRGFAAVAACGVVAAGGLIATAVGSSAPAPPVGHATYLIRDLGDLGGAQSMALAMNDEGLIVGWSEIRQAPTDKPFSQASDARQHHAFVWDGRHMIDLGHLGGGFSEARGINDFGEIVGTSLDARGELRAAYWYDGVIFDLTERVLKKPIPFDPLANDLVLFFEANGIGNDGSVVGCGYVRGDENVHGIILEPIGRCGFGDPWFRARDLGRLAPNADCIAHEVNIYGEVVGISGRTAFLWKDGLMEPIEDPMPPDIVMSEARAINLYGDAAGSECGIDARPFACVWRDGEAIALESPAHHVTVANDLNNLDEVVGWTARNPDGEREAMIWTGVRGRRLSHVPLIPLPTSDMRWEILNEATAIDDHGRIAGYGKTTDGRIRAFVLFPDI